MKKAVVFVFAFLVIALILLRLSVNENPTLAPLPVPERTATEDTVLSPSGDSLPSASVANEETALAKPSDFPDQHLLSAFGNRFRMSDDRAPLASTGGQGTVIQFEPVNASWPVRVEREERHGHRDASLQLMVANRALVIPNLEISAEELEALAARLDARLVPQRQPDSVLRVFEFADYEDATRLPRLLEALNEEPRLVAYAEPDFLYRLSRIPNDPEYRFQRAMDSPLDASNAIDPDINAGVGWDKRSSAASQIVAVIDSGIQLNNVDLSQNLWTNRRERLDGKDSDNNGYTDDIHGIDLIDPGTAPDDEDGHGTAVSGLIGAKGNNGYAMAGVAWSVQLMSIRIFGRDGYATTEDAVEGIEYAIRNGAKIINASWGGPGDSLALKTAIRKANTAGVLFVTSAGNEGLDLDATPRYPSNFDLPNMLSVAATSRYGDKTSFSNWGSRIVHIAAPGEQVLSLSIKRNTVVDRFSGTSFAAPLVTGIAALTREQFGPETPESLRRRIIASARTSPERRLEWVSSQGYADLSRVLNGLTSAPSNDMRVDAIPLTPAANRHLVNTVTATSEVGEALPDASGGWGTLWYSVAPEYDKPYTIALNDFAQNATIRFFRGESLAPVTPLAIDSSGRYKIENSADGPLYIQVAGKSLLWFELFLEAPPANDNFADAIDVLSEPFNDAVYNLYATVEEGEPFVYVGPRNSIWWKYRAEEDGPFFLSTAGGDADTMLRVYTGDSLSSLTLLDSNDDAHSKVRYSELLLEVSKGVTYYFQVKSHYQAEARVYLRGELLRTPRFVTMPSSVTLPLGARAALGGVAVGPKPISYQWLFEGEPLEGATSNSLVIDSVDETTIGSYALRAFSPGGEATSSSARVAIFGRTPQFALHPASGDYRIGASPTLSVHLEDDRGASYQWYKDGQAIPGATGASLTIDKGDASRNGVYRAEATNENGKAVSREASLFFGDDQGLLRRLAFEDEGFDLIGYAKVYGATNWFATDHNKLWRSTNGFDWEPVQLRINGREASGGGVERIEFGNGHYFVVGGSSWATGPTLDSLVSAGNALTGERITTAEVKFIDGYFYAHRDGDLVRSLDGMAWENTSARVHALKNIVALRPGGPYATVQSEKFLYSENMTQWVERSFPVQSFDGKLSIVSDGSRFVVFLHDSVADKMKAYTTSDGSAWTLLPALPADAGYVSGAVYSGNRFILLAQGTLLVSSNLESWQEHPLDTSFMESIVSHAGLVFADSSVIAPTRLFGSVAGKASVPPLILPIDMKSSYLPSPGETLAFLVDARGIDAPLDRVEFRVGGELRKTLIAPPFEFEWTAGSLGVYSIEAVAYDKQGDASSRGSTVTVTTNQLTPVSLRNNPKSIRFMADAFGSTYAVSGTSQLYRFSEELTWTPCHTFAEPGVSAMFVFRDELYVAAGDDLYCSKDGLRWELALREVGDAAFHPGESWLIVSRRKAGELKAWYTVDGESWILSTAPDAWVYGAFEGSLVCSVDGFRDQIGLLGPGNEMETFSLPPGDQMDGGFTDGVWYYVRMSGINTDFGQTEAPLYRTRTFADWEEVEGRGRTLTAYADGVYRAGYTAFSKDRENWVETDFYLDDVIEIETGYIVSSGGNLLYSANGIDWDTALVGYASVLRRTASGYFAWSAGDGGSGIYFSTDGRRWMTLYEVENGVSHYYTDMVFGNQRYVAVGSGIACSADGDSWMEIAPSFAPDGHVVFGNGRFVATTKSLEGAMVATSLDGLEWKRFATGSPRTHDPSVAFLSEEGAFLFYDGSSSLQISNDGESWQAAVDRSVRWALLLEDCVYAGFEGDAKTYFSRDCKTWLETPEVARVIANGDYYSRNLISGDGVNWRSLDFIGVPFYNEAIVPLSDGSTLMAVGTTLDNLSVYYKTRHGALEGTALYGTDARPLVIKFVNGRTYVLGHEIHRFTTQDLQLAEVTLMSNGESLKIGATLSLKLRIRNHGAERENLEGLSLQSRLADEGRWNGQSGYALGDVTLPRVFIPAGAERELTVAVQIPSGTRPGSYSLVALLNPELAFDESTLANNHAWETSNRITIASGSLSVEVVGNGQVSCTPDRDSYALGDTVLLTALPDPKHRVKEAVGATLGKQNLYFVSIQEATSARFEFEESSYTVAVVAVGKGAVSVSPVKQSYTEGEVVTLTAVADSGARFSGWSGSVESQLSELSIPMRADLEAIGVFGIPYSVWAAERFSPEQMESGLLAEMNQDPDSDGITNLWEYLMGSDPQDGKGFPLLSCSMEYESLVMRYAYCSLVLDYSIILQSSSDGRFWAEVKSGVETPSTLEETINVEFAAPLLNQNALFFRLVARQDAEP